MNYYYENEKFQKNRPVSASAKMTRKRRRVCSSASGAKYAPIINRDLDYFENDVEKYVGKRAPILRKWLEEQDFVLDEMSGPAKDKAWESWRLDTEAGNIMVVFYFDLIPSGKAGRLNEGKITKAYVEDNQDSKAISDEESRLFSSTKMRKCKVSASKRTGKRSIMAGPGAGYSIQWDMNDVISVKSFNPIEVISAGKNFDDEEFFEADIACDVEVAVTIKSAWSYGYGTNEEIETTARVTRMYIDADDPDNLPYMDANELNSILYGMGVLTGGDTHSGEWESNLGGGYMHSKFTGELADADDSHSITRGWEGWTVTLTDKRVIDYIDKAVSGENVYTNYTLYDQDMDVIDSYDDLMAAQNAAEEFIASGQYDEIICYRTEEMETFNGDWETVDEEVEFTFDESTFS